MSDSQRERPVFFHTHCEATIASLQSKWDFEHAIALDQEAEIKRLDAEVADLRARIADAGTRGAPSYEPPPADPLLASETKHR